MKVSGVEAKHFLAQVRVGQVKLMRAGNVALRAYAKELSLWQHKVIRRYARTQLNGRTDFVALAQAKAEIRALVERDFQRKSTRGRRRHARFLQSHTQESLSEPTTTSPQAPFVTGELSVCPKLDVQKFRCAPKHKRLFEGMITYREAASMLNTRLRLVRGLVARGVISCCRLGKRRSKQIVAEEVWRFAQKYVSVGAIAERFNKNRCWVNACLKAAGVPVLAVPVLGRGKMFFVAREVADQLQITVSRSGQTHI